MDMDVMVAVVVDEEEEEEEEDGACVGTPTALLAAAIRAANSLSSRLASLVLL